MNEMVEEIHSQPYVTDTVLLINYTNSKIEKQVTPEVSIESQKG